MSATDVVGQRSPGAPRDTATAEGASSGDAPASTRTGRAFSRAFSRLELTPVRISILLVPALIYLGVREFGLLVLTWMAGRNNVRVSDALTSWDGQWYLGIATGGYDGVPAGLVDAYGRREAETPLAFFPGYPMVVRWLAAVDGTGGLQPAMAGFLISGVAGVFCAYALARIGRGVAGGSDRAGYALVALFAASPMGIVLSMTYSEALFCALAAWALVGVLERKWLLAGVCCALAGLVRPTAAALVLAVGLAALVAVLRRRDGWRPWVAGVVAPVGLLSYLGWVATRTGEIGGYFALQERGWDSKFDGGAATLNFTLDALSRARSVLEVATVALIVVAVVLAIVGFVRRVEWPLMVYGLAALVMDVGSNGIFTSKARLLVPAFTLLIPVALALAKRRPSTMVLTAASVTVAGAWFGAYTLTAWHYAI